MYNGGRTFLIIGGSKMKIFIIITALFVSSGLMAMDGERVYKQHCLVCHGENAKKTPGAIAPLAGRDASSLASKIRVYRDLGDKVGCYATTDKNSMIVHSMTMQESTYDLTEEHIIALAKYISSLK